MTPLSLLNEALPGEWGDTMGLSRTKDFFGTHALTELVDYRLGGMKARVEALHREYGLDHALFDHAEKFRAKSRGGSIVAVVTSPYLWTLSRQFNDLTEANTRIHGIASDCGLAVRVGHLSDVVYVSDVDNNPTVPIVWWNPKRVGIALPKIGDPRPRFADRLGS